MNMPTVQWLPRFGNDFQICLQQMDIASNRALLVLLDEAAYRNASFLDQRALAHNPPGQWFSLDEVWSAAGGQQNSLTPHYIFHIGHCGSTLISRLLDQLGAFGLREPLPFRSLAEAEASLGEAWSLLSPEAFDQQLRALNALWSRRPPSGAVPIVKATSQCSGLSTNLLTLSPGARALTLGLKLERYLATVLAGQYAPFEFRAAAPLRLQRLSRLGVGNLPMAADMGTPEFAALAWLTETFAARQLAHSSGTRVMHVDFDDFLQAPSEQLSMIAKHFGLAPSAAEIDQAVNGPTMSRYSKAPEHGYSTNVRDQLVSQSSIQNAEGIRAGSTWVQQLMSQNNLLSDTLEGAL